MRVASSLLRGIVVAEVYFSFTLAFFLLFWKTQANTYILLILPCSWRPLVTGQLFCMATLVSTWKDGVGCGNFEARVSGAPRATEGAKMDGRILPCLALVFASMIALFIHMGVRRCSGLWVWIESGIPWAVAVGMQWVECVC